MYNFVQYMKNFFKKFSIYCINPRHLFLAIDYKNQFTCISKHKERFLLIVEVTLKLDNMVNFQLESFRKFFYSVF